MGTATVRLRRKGLGAEFGSSEIIIDGTSVGSIAKNEAVEIPVEPGRHTLRLKSGRRHVSPQVAFEVTDGEVVSFWCRSALFWPIWLAAYVKPDLDITLKREN